ncbi:MAG TPA: hypothetical protein VK436_05790 [Methanocella sp.]|nr:hypothetical protein [Methanocella sp.]
MMTIVKYLSEGVGGQGARKIKVGPEPAHAGEKLEPEGGISTYHQCGECFSMKQEAPP